jgi:hypothetical protein
VLTISAMSYGLLAELVLVCWQAASALLFSDNAVAGWLVRHACSTASGSTAAVRLACLLGGSARRCMHAFVQHCAMKCMLTAAAFPAGCVPSQAVCHCADVVPVACWLSYGGSLRQAVPQGACPCCAEHSEALCSSVSSWVADGAAVDLVLLATVLVGSLMFAGEQCVVCNLVLHMY